MGEQQTDWIEQRVASLRALLLEALQAGLFLGDDAAWRPHHSGEILYFADRAFGVERPAVLVLTQVITQDIVSESVDSDFRTYLIVGGKVADGVDLGEACAQRAGRMADAGENYWAAFVVDGMILATVGTPLSWCRLVGEVLNAQMPSPFVQQRICANCHGLNDYHTTTCRRCGRPITLTGKLG